MPTKKEKIIAYTYALLNVMDDPDVGICGQIIDAFVQMNYCFDLINLQYQAREFYKYKPKNSNRYSLWWPTSTYGQKQRIKVLTEIIESL